MVYIGHNPNNASYYGNRAAALMMLDKYSSALEDAVRSTQHDENFVKGYLRAAKCHLMLGNPSLSVDFYNKVLTLQPKNTQAVQEVAYNGGCYMTLLIESGFPGSCAASGASSPRLRQTGLQTS